MMSGLWQDVRHSIRTLIKAPGFTMTASLVLALGIGANSVTFSIVYNFFMRPLPVEEPDRLVRIYSGFTDGFQYATVSYPDYRDMLEMKDVFSEVLADKLIPFSISAEGRNERLWGYIVSGNYFEVLGVQPELGRFFLPEEDEAPGKHPVVVLSHGLWQRRFGGSRGVLGRQLTLNGQPFTIVGVAPQSFNGVNLGLRPEVWAPQMMEDVLMPFNTLEERNTRSHFAIARLQPDASIEEARAALDVLANRLQETYPDSNQGISFNVLPEAEGGVHPMMRGGFLGFSGVLMLVVALVLLLACANVGGLLVARAAARRKEISVRLAIGAGRKRLLQQLLTESMMLAGLAAGLGLLIATVSIRVLSTLALPIDVPLFLDLRLDTQVIVFTLLVALTTGIIFGLAPALQGTRLDLVSALKDTAGTVGPRRSRLRSFLVGGQVALSTVLLIGAGLFLRSLQNANQVDLGFNPEGIAMTSLDLSLQGYEEEEGKRFLRQLKDRLNQIPGVESASLASAIPFDLNINQTWAAPEGYEPPPDGSMPSIDYAAVEPGYFRTMGIPMLYGRDFTNDDTEETTRVVIINEALAKRFWPDEPAVGKRILSRQGTPREVVGVVKTGKYLTLGEEPKSYLYFAQEQSGFLSMTAVVRTSADPLSVLGRVREEIERMDASLSLYNVKAMDEHLHIALVPARVGAWILGSFGALALLLASVGLYGMMAYSVTRRTYEIALRRALGAQDGTLLKLVMKQGLSLVFAGVAVGVLGALAAGRVMASLLYGVSATDPMVMIQSVLVLFLVTLAACYFPAQRALRVDPKVALHYE
jgi:predicted permease